MELLNSLFTTLRERRLLVGAISLCVIIGLVLTAFLVPFPPDEADTGEAFETQPFGPDGSYTAESTLTRTGSTGYLFPALTRNGGPLLASSPAWEYTQTTTVAHDATYGITYSVVNWSIEHPTNPQSMRIETYDKGELKYQRVTASNTALVDEEVQRCADSPCFSHRVSDNEMYRVYLAEQRSAPRLNPATNLPESEFALQQVDSEYEFVETTPIQSIEGDIQTNERGAISEAHGTLTRIPENVTLRDGTRHEVASPEDLALAPKRLAPRLTVTFNASSSSGIDGPIEQPAWATEMERQLNNDA